MTDEWRGRLGTIAAVLLIVVALILTGINYRTVQSSCTNGVVVRAAWVGFACSAPQGK